MLQINRIHNLDCVEGMRRLAPACIDLTVTSPPYDNLRSYDGLSWNFNKTAGELYRITKDGGVVVWVVGDATISGSETGTSFRQALHFKEIGFNLHDTMIFQKNSFSNPSSNRYHQVFEYMFVFSKGQPKTFNPIKDRLNRYNKLGGDSARQVDGSLVRGKNTGKKFDKYGQRFNIWRYTVGGGHVATEKIAHQHPAIFPEKLAEDHILSWSNKGDLVLDPFSGSGTTAKMAIVNDRNYIGFEISEKYCAVAEGRLRAVPKKLNLEVR